MCKQGFGRIKWITVAPSFYAILFLFFILLLLHSNALTIVVAYRYSTFGVRIFLFLLFRRMCFKLIYFWSFFFRKPWKNMLIVCEKKARLNTWDNLRNTPEQMCTSDIRNKAIEWGYNMLGKKVTNLSNDRLCYIIMYIKSLTGHSKIEIKTSIYLV